jgi:arylsulfatase A-like enzyme
MMAAMGVTRRTFIGAAPLALVRGAARPPNLLFLLTDDQRWDSLGCMGNPIVRTPNIDGLARAGVTFTNHCVTTSICVVSRASIFSGLYARNHGILAFNQQFSSDQFVRTYPAVLRRAGYRTGFIGKYGLDGGTLPEDGFDYWRGFRGQGNYFPKDPGGPHLTEIMSGQAREFIEAAKPGEPFCLSVSFKAPHVQDEDPRQFLYDPRDQALYRDVTIPPPLVNDPRCLAAFPLSVERSEMRRRWAVRFSTPELYQESVKSYYRLITGMDRAVGEMLAALQRGGLTNDTVVVFTSDNGFYLGERGLAGKWLMHEESIRVPLIIRDPRISTGNVRRSAITLNIDLAPTLLDLAGVTSGPPMQGRSLTPLLSDARLPWRNEFFYEHRFKNDWIPQTEGVRGERWKYTLYVNEQPRFEELYDLGSDPLEVHNLARSPAQRPTLDRLRARHQAWVSALEAWHGETPWRDPA